LSHIRSMPQPSRPAGRLVAMLGASGHPADAHAATLALARKAASFGETVLVLDACQGALMREAGIVWSRSLADVVAGTAEVRDAVFVTSNEHFSATTTGDLPLHAALGTLAALSLSYDWLFCVPEAGCTPAHVRLAAGADVSVMMYDTQGDDFMRAFWMIEAVRHRAPNFDPHVVSTGERAEAVETALMLSDTVRDHLGAPPPYSGHVKDLHAEVRLLERLRASAKRSQVA